MACESNLCVVFVKYVVVGRKCPEDKRLLPERRGCHENTLSSTTKYCQKMEHANQGLGVSSQPIWHHIWRTPRKPFTHLDLHPLP